MRIEPERVKTTLRLDKGLMNELKHRAIDTEQTVTQLVEIAIWEYLRHRKKVGGKSSK